MSKKTVLILAGVLVILLAGGILFLKSRQTSTPEEEIGNLVTQMAQEKDVQVSLTAKPGKKEVVLAISKIPANTVSIEYQVKWTTKKGSIQGTGTTPSKPVEVAGQTTIERTLTLGTCSTGGKCVYDEVVGKISVEIKFNKSSGESTGFSQEFEI